MVHLPDRDSDPKFIKDFQIGVVAGGACGTLPGSGPRMEAFKRMGQENPGTDQAHKSCDCLNHGYRPLSPRGQNDRALAQSKGFHRQGEKRIQLMIWRNSRSRKNEKTRRET
jgi:hypothetical protein